MGYLIMLYNGFHFYSFIYAPYEERFEIFIAATKASEPTLSAILQQKYNFYLKKPNLSLSFFKLEHLQMETCAQKKEMKHY